MLVLVVKHLDIRTGTPQMVTVEVISYKYSEFQKFSIAHIYTVQIDIKKKLKKCGNLHICCCYSS